MKNIIKTIIGVLLLFLIMGSIFAYGGNNGNGKGKGFGKNQGGQVYQIYDDTQVNHQIQIDSYPIEDLSQVEIDALIYMREEEKLARDVYLELYDIWGQQIFLNIARSEETHTNAINLLLIKYNIEDPMTNDELGVFKNQDLQNLYDSLIEKGSVSFVDALIVGATIEDLDIKDLQDDLVKIDNQDISAVFNNLMKGSRNHLRSFTKNIERNGGTYEAQHISQEYYENILSFDMETGTQYDSSGDLTLVDNLNKNKNPNLVQNRNEIMNTGNGQRQGQGQSQITENNQNMIEQEDKIQSQNMFSRMWRGFKGMFN